MCFPAFGASRSLSRSSPKAEPLGQIIKKSKESPVPRVFTLMIVPKTVENPRCSMGLEYLCINIWGSFLAGGKFVGKYTSPIEGLGLAHTEVADGEGWCLKDVFGRTVREMRGCPSKMGRMR